MTDAAAPSEITAAPFGNFRAVVDAAPALISFFDSNHICRFANAFHNVWYGRSPDELIGLHMRDFIGPERYGQRAPFLARVAAGESVAFDAEVPDSLGGLRDGAVRYIPRMGPGGFEGFYILVFDVGRRKRELAEMLDVAHDAIFVRALDDTVTFWNRGCELMYGVDRKDALGRKATALLQTTYAQAPGDLASLSASGGWEGEVTRKMTDGSDALIAVRWSLRRDEEGAPIEILETGRDVTEARRAEEEVRRSEHRFRNVFQAMAVSYWELDFSAVGKLLGALRAGGVTDLRAHVASHPGFVRKMMQLTRVIDINDKTLQIFGGAREDFLGPVAPFWPPSSEHVYAQSVYAALEGQHSLEAETAFYSVDGRLIDALFTCCFPREGVGAGKILVGIIDITDRLRAERELNKAHANLAHAGRVATLGELTASIAHEVNQPLSAIVTSGEAGLRWLGRPEPNLAEVRASMEHMISQGQRASDIISRIRAMARKSDADQQACSVNEIIEETLFLLQREVSIHEVDLTLRLDPAAPQILCDRIQIQQILINLAMNAIQAMTGQGQDKDQVRGKSQRRLEVRSQGSQSGVHIQVADTGPGIDPGMADQLFNAFYTTKDAGMGMGLSICKTIVAGHRGRIWADTGPEGGSIFHVTLPAAAEA